MDDLRWASATQQAALLRRGEVAPGELRALAVETIERLDPQLRAVVAPLFDRAGDGVPILLKDAGQELDGTPHWVGVAALRDAGSRSTATTALAGRLEQLGLSIIGKAACPQLSNGVTTEPPGFEPTRNPWDTERSAGGSSGGPAAAVASGMVALAHGSDATGSLRCPAALCGLVTLVPTAGAVPGVPPAGQPPNDAWRDFALARHTEDVAWLFEALTGAAAPPRRTSLRIGFLDHDPELGLSVDPACAEGVHVTTRLLEEMGHRIEEAWPTPLDDLWAACAAAFTVVSDATRPPVIEWVSQRLGRPVRDGELEPQVFEAAARAADRAEDDVRDAAAVIDSAVAPIVDWWDDHDVLVTPTTFHPAWPLGGRPGPAELGTLVAPFSLTGQPSMSVPVHQTTDGLPVGVQLVARKGDDHLLLQLAADLEAATEWPRRRPPVS